MPELYVPRLFPALTPSVQIKDVLECVHGRHQTMWDHAHSSHLITLIHSHCDMQSCLSLQTATTKLLVGILSSLADTHLATFEPQHGMPGSSATLFPSCSLVTPSPTPTTSLQDVTQMPCFAGTSYLSAPSVTRRAC